MDKSTRDTLLISIDTFFAEVWDKVGLALYLG